VGDHHVKRMVLIADGNTGRGRRLAEACTSAGVECKTGPHGAAALEMALAELPGLVVAQLDLPLVDALKLAEILRANPRTRGARFLVLGEDETPAQTGRAGDAFLPSGSPPDDVVRVIAELIEKQERIENLDVATDGGEPVEGDLTLIPLAELLSLFQLNRKNGRLQLTCDDGEGGSQDGMILIRDGEVIQAEAGVVSREKALFRLLGCRQGGFAFTPGRTDEPPVILSSTRVLLQEGARQIAEWDRLAPKLPPLDCLVKMRIKSSELPNIVHPLTQEVLLSLELYATVREVVDHSSFPDYQVLRTLHTLAEREIIELERVSLPEVQSTSAETLLNAAQVRRLRDWMSEVSGRPEPLAPAKLLVATADPTAVPDFANLLGNVRGVNLSPEMLANEVGEHDLGPIGELVLDPETRVELLHLPVADRYAPLWPAAGHAALGTLFLLNGAVGETSDKVQRTCRALADLPRARTFHVILLRKGERISPDELRDNLSLIDEASLFLLPLESGKDPTTLLRGLFGRVMP
jgi:CheY-like chemotaxis protein